MKAARVAKEWAGIQSAREETPATSVHISMVLSTPQRSATFPRATLEAIVVTDEMLTSKAD